MNSKTSLLSVAALVAAVAAAHAESIALPAPRTVGGMPLREALAARATARDYAPTPLSLQELSDLLWAAFGYNRPAKRTAPTAMNRQEITLYAYTPDGVFRYEPGPEESRLEQLSTEDLREKSGFQPFAAKAPLVLIYVVDMDKMRIPGGAPGLAERFAAVDCGFVGQNVYLHAASEGLHTCYLGRVDAAKVSPVLGLAEKQVPLFAQCVGHPAAAEPAAE